MQTVAAYLMERAGADGDSGQLKAHGEEALSIVERWLEAKGSSDLSTGSGTYSAIDGSNATFRRSSAIDGVRSWNFVVLEEITDAGRVFRTSVSVTTGSTRVVVFVTMEVGTTLSNLTRVDSNPKCPSIVRDILALSDGWTHGGTPLHTDKILVQGEQQGEYLAELLQSKTRAVPLVVVSIDGDTEVLPGLSESLAYDLAGLANVVTIDAEAAWSLTRILGKPLSVFGGAIRIYWPDFDSSTDSPFRHQLWTASKLVNLEGDSLNRVRLALRRTVMGASAASVTRPAEIDEIRSAKARAEYSALLQRSEELDRLKASASSLSDFESLADTYAIENDALRVQIEERNGRISELEDELRDALDERRRLRYQLENAGARNSDEDVPPDTPGPEQSEKTPVLGDVRFYKKIGSTPKYDVLEEVGGCGHSAWQASHGADKARKGLQRLKLPDWKKLQHCGTCTGGGMWRVEW